jgi:hypothetical protein
MYELLVILYTETGFKPSEYVKSHGPTPVKLMFIFPRLALFTQIESVPLIVAVTGGIIKMAMVTVSPKQPREVLCSTNFKVSIPETEHA